MTNRLHNLQNKNNIKIPNIGLTYWKFQHKFFTSFFFFFLNIYKLPYKLAHWSKRTQQLSIKMNMTHFSHIEYDWLIGTTCCKWLVFFFSKFKCVDVCLDWNFSQNYRDKDIIYCNYQNVSILYLKTRTLWSRKKALDKSKIIYNVNLEIL